jgi:WD40 repeat protein
MGCDGTPVINYEHSYSICTMTISNLTDELIKIYPLPYDRLLACSCRNYKILDINEQKDKETHEFEDEIFNLILWTNLNESKLIEGSCNGDLIIHDLETKENKRKGGHLSTVMALLIMKNGSLLTASSDGCIYMWNPNDDFNEITHFYAHRAPIWNICEVHRDTIITTCDDGKSKMFALKNNPNERCVLVFNTPKCRCLSKMKNKRIVFNLDKNLVIYQINKIPDVSEDIPIIRKKKKNEPDFRINEAHDALITCIITISSGEIISGSEDGIIKIFHSKYNYQCVSVLTGHMERINFIDEYPGGKLVTCGDDKKIKFWEKNKDEYKSDYHDLH